MEARNRARDALHAFREDGSKVAEWQRGIALNAVWNAHDLTEVDKRRVERAVKGQWADLEQEALGAVPAEPPANLAEMLARYPMQRATAAALGPLTAEELFAS
jgi:hypothetical protein